MFFISFVEVRNIFKMNMAMTMLEYDLTGFGYIFIDERRSEDFVSFKTASILFWKRSKSSCPWIVKKPVQNKLLTVHHTVNEKASLPA